MLREHIDPSFSFLRPFDFAEDLVVGGPSAPSVGGGRVAVSALEALVGAGAVGGGSVAVVVGVGGGGVGHCLGFTWGLFQTACFGIFLVSCFFGQLDQQKKKIKKT